MIPVENVYLTAEVKSTLTTRDLEQVTLAQQKLFKLSSTLPDEQNNNLKVFNVIIAYDTNVAENTLKNWLNSSQNTLSVCILGKYTLSKSSSNGIEIFEHNQNDTPFYETLCFYAQMFNYLRMEVKKREYFTPNWNAYILGLKPQQN